MVRLYTFSGQDKAQIYALEARHILWLEEADPLKESGKDVGLLKVFSRSDEINPFVIRATLTDMIPKEDFRYWLCLTLPTGRYASVNFEKIKDLQHRDGGTDIIFHAVNGQDEGSGLFVTETPARIKEMMRMDFAAPFFELVAHNAIEDAQLLSKHGISPRAHDTWEPPEPT